MIRSDMCDATVRVASFFEANNNIIVSPVTCINGAAPMTRILPFTYRKCPCEETGVPPSCQRYRSKNELNVCLFRCTLRVESIISYLHNLDVRDNSSFASTMDLIDYSMAYI